MWLKDVIAVSAATSDDSTWPQALRLPSVAGAYRPRLHYIKGMLQKGATKGLALTLHRRKLPAIAHQNDEQITVLRYLFNWTKSIATTFQDKYFAHSEFDRRMSFQIFLIFFP